MKPVPSISVVMSVFNNEETLSAALKSILSQEGVDLEFIVINDGSTDSSGKILDEVATRDSRLKVVHKKNEGLTQALSEGCAMASAPWIARQDADDISLPRRLRAQLDRALQSDAPVLIACGSMYCTPEGIEMFPSIPDGDLNRKILRDVESPCAHGAALFSKDAYMAVGGYRPEFYYAQDLDLFTRLAGVGPVVAVREVLYGYTFSPHSISTYAAAVQKQYRAIIKNMLTARQLGYGDSDLLEEAAALSRQVCNGSVRKADSFAGYYFIGCCLLQKNPKDADAYLEKAMRQHPLSVKTWIRRVQAMVLSNASSLGRKLK